MKAWQFILRDTGWHDQAILSKFCLYQLQWIVTGNLFYAAGCNHAVVGTRFIASQRSSHFIQCCRFSLMCDDQVGVDADEGKTGGMLSAGNTFEQEAVRAFCRFTIGRYGCLQVTQDVAIK